MYNEQLYLGGQRVGVDDWFSDAVSTVSKVVTAPVKAVADITSSIPIVGDITKIAADAAAAPMKLATAIASGQRVDKALLDAAKNQLKIIKDAAPYAQAVIAVVPGIGTGVSAAISAGAALAEGRPIDEIAKAAIKGALPGGAVAAAGFDAALKVAAGGNVLQSALSVAREALPSEAAKKAFDVGLAVATGENAQKAFTKAVVSSIGGGSVKEVMDKGLYSMLANKALAAGLKNIPLGGSLTEQGYKLAAGLIAAKGINEKSMVEARKNLSGEALQGFDTALKTQEASLPWVKNVVNAPVVKPPVLKAVTPKAPAPATPAKPATPAAPAKPTLKAVTPKAPATPATPATPPAHAGKYGPYPHAQSGAVHGLGANDERWRWFTVYANGKPFVQRGPMWLSDYEARNEAAGYLESTQGRGYIGTVKQWAWDSSLKKWRPAA